MTIQAIRIVAVGSEKLVGGLRALRFELAGPEEALVLTSLTRAELRYLQSVVSDILAARTDAQLTAALDRVKA